VPITRKYLMPRLNAPVSKFLKGCSAALNIVDSVFNCESKKYANSIIKLTNAERGKEGSLTTFG